MLGINLSIWTKNGADSSPPVPQPPNLSNIFNLKDIAVNEVFSFDLNTLNTGGQATSWTWNGTPPSWLSSPIPSTGIISGIALEGSWAGYSVTASNIDGSSTSNTDDLTIVDPFAFIIDLTETTDVGAFIIDLIEDI